MQAIIVKFMPATNCKGARLQVSAGKNRPKKYVSYQYDGFSVEADRAAKAYAEKMLWVGTLLQGSIDDGLNVYVFAQSNKIK